MVIASEDVMVLMQRQISIYANVYIGYRIYYLFINYMVVDK